jgi:hypothetical protein
MPVHQLCFWKVLLDNDIETQLPIPYSNAQNEVLIKIAKPGLSN